jgi:hypothetical protein
MLTFSLFFAMALQEGGRGPLKLLNPRFLGRQMVVLMTGGQNVHSTDELTHLYTSPPVEMLAIVAAMCYTCH